VVKRAVIRIRQGPIVTHRNGITGPQWVALDLACGHTVTKRPSEVGARPRFSRCRQCAAKKEARA
jgi:hypothetical protein